MTDTSTLEQIDKITGNDERKTIDKVEKLFSRAKSARLPFERQWYMNLAFYFGKQYAQFQPKLGDQPARIWEPPAPPWRVRLVSNKIKPIARTEMAKLTKERPQAFVIPASSDDADLLAARAGEAIFEHQWRELKVDSIIRQAAFWTINTGNGFIKDWYDPYAVDKDKKKGVIRAEVVTPFHIYVPDIAEPDLDGQPFIIHSVAKSVDWVESTYKKKIPKESGGGSFEAQFFSALGISQGNRGDEVTVREMWIRECKDFPKGAVIHWAADKILSISEGWPYDHQEYPFSHIQHVPTGRFYADSVIPDLIPLQKEYNRTRSQMVESKNRMSKPQLMAPRGSVDPNKITSEPGLVILYTPGFNPPTPLPLQDIPAYVKEELDLCQRDMDDISSQHEITKGRTPPGVTAATAISYLQEEDDSKLASTISSLEEAVERVGRHFLSHVKQFWVAEKAIKVAGENGAFEMLMLSRSDLRNNTDLKVESGSATPRSKAAKQAFITEIGKMGWIEPTAALKHLDMAETAKLYEESQIDARQAQRENLRMAKNGEILEPNAYDEHQVHIIEHNNYRKRQEFENLPDELKVLFQEHVMLHEQALGIHQGQPVLPGEAQLGVPSARGASEVPEGEGVLGPNGQVPGNEQVAQESSGGPQQ